MKYQIILKIYLVLVLGTPFCLKAQDTNEKKVRTKLELVIVNDQGEPVSEAQVIVGGIANETTDQRGHAFIEALPDELVRIKKFGYDEFSSIAENLNPGEEIKLSQGDLFNDDDDEIRLPFMTIRKRFSTSGSTVVSGEKLEKYPSIDFRNSLTGLALGLQVKEVHGAPEVHSEESLGDFYSQKVQLYSRGRSPIYIIDDVPTDVTEVQIEPHEIASATIIKDIVAKSMYGPQAADGIIFIKTRRGKFGENQLKVNIEGGVSLVDRFPQWTTATDYCNLNNEARINGGLPALYLPDDIGEYSKNDPNNLYYPSVNFREMSLKDFVNMRKANVSYEGGKKDVRFFTSLGYTGTDDLYKIGPDAGFDRLNARSNLDLNINDLLSVHLNIFGGLTIRQSPQYYSGTLNKFVLMLNDINTNSPVAFPVYAKLEPENNIRWYGVDPIFTNNPIGAIEENGYYSEYGRTGTTNISLDYDMKNIVKGLKSKTFFSFDIFNLVRIGKVEQYAAYNVIPSKTSSGADTILLVNVVDRVEQANQSNMHDYYYQRFGGYQNLTYDKDFGGGSSLTASLTYYLSTVSRDTRVQPERQQNVVLSTSGVYKDKYIFSGVLNFAGSSSLAPNNRYALFPSVGVGWIASEESFLSDMKFLDFLKIRGEAGILGYEAFSAPFYYKDLWTHNTTGGSFGAAPTGYWFGSDTEPAKRTNPSRIGNPNLDWERRREFTIGMDVVMFQNKLSVELNYYNQLRDGILTNLTNTLPYTSGIASQYSFVNYNRYRYYGMEGSVQYSDKIGDFAFSIGANISLPKTKVLKYDEPDYRFKYQSSIGKPIDAYWGLTYLGRFASKEETLEIPQLFDETLSEGDLKYKDLNGDEVIDDNDRSMIGRTSPELEYALNLKMQYKDFDFTLIADGRASVDLPLTNNYFRNGWGDGNYSEFVRDNIDGAYPRLTYYQVSNNFQNSDFWITKGGYFKIQNVELAYTLSPKAARSVFSKKIRLFVRGANLLTITNVRYVDPESPNAGVSAYPLFRTFTGGLNLIF